MATDQLGKLLRLRAMVTATQLAHVSRAVIGAYTTLLEELTDAVSDEPTLVAELERVFKPLPNPATGYGPQVEEAGLKLRMLAGWIQGLIDEATLEHRLRMEAEEKAKLEAKLKPGFNP
jgi:hypothetical protein